MNSRIYSLFVGNNIVIKVSAAQIKSDWLKGGMMRHLPFDAYLVAAITKMRYISSNRKICHANARQIPARGLPEIMLGSA